MADEGADVVVIHAPPGKKCRPVDTDTCRVNEYDGRKADSSTWVIGFASYHSAPWRVCAVHNWLHRKRVMWPRWLCGALDYLGGSLCLIRNYPAVFDRKYPAVFE